MTGLPPQEPFPVASANPPFRVGNAISEGWGAMTFRYGPILGAVVIFALIQFALSLTQMFLEAGSPALGSAFSLVTTFFLVPPISAGLFFMGVRAYRREAIGVAALFDGFERYWPIVGINVLLTLIIVACLIPAAACGLLAATMARNAPVVFGALLLAGVVVSLLLVVGFSVRLSLATAACLDPYQGRLGVVESLQTSWRMSHPVAWKLLFVYILTGLIAVLTLLLLCVGVLFLGYPLGVGVFGAAYGMLAAPLLDSPTDAGGDGPPAALPDDELMPPPGPVGDAGMPPPPGLST